MQTFLRRLVWLCLILVPFVALYVASGYTPATATTPASGNFFDFINWNTSGFYFPFISGKNLLFRFLVEIAFFGWIAIALKDAKYRLNIRKSPLLIAYAIFMAVLLLADMFGIDPFRSFWSNFERMEGFFGHIHLFAYFVVLSAMLRTKENYGTMFKAFIISNIAVLVFGYGQLLGVAGNFFTKYLPAGLISKFSAAFPVHMSENRLDATLGNSAYFAIYCLIFAFILALRWSGEKEPKKTWWYPLLIILNIVALFYTGTRGTQIGLIVGALTGLGVLVFRWVDSKKEVIALVASTVIYLAYMAIALFANNALLAYFAPISYLYAVILLIVAITTALRAKDRLRKIGAGVFIAIIAVILAFQIPAIKHSSFVQNSSTLSRIASISPTDVTGMSRLSIWKISLQAFKERPILGYGQENFSYIFASKFIPDKMYNLEAWYDRSHDVFFDWLVAGGVLGLAAYLSLYVVALWLMWRKKSDMPSMERATLTGALAGYFVHNIFVFDNLVSYILFFFLLAYIAWRTGTRGEVEHGKPVGAEMMNMLYLPIIGILFLGVAYEMVYKPVEVNHLLVRGLDVNRLVQSMPFPEAVKIQQDSFEKAIQMHVVGSEEAREQFLQTTVKMSQITIPADVSAGDRQAAVQALNNLIAAARNDVETSYDAHKNDVRMLSIYGMFYNGLNDGALADKVLTRAHDLAPNKQLISFDLVRAYLIEGKSDQAYALARQTYDLAPAYADAAKIYLLAAVYDKKWNEASDYIASKGLSVPLDADILTGLVTTKQIPLAVQLLTELKKTNPAIAPQVDAYIKQLLAAPAK